MLSSGFIDGGTSQKFELTFKSPLTIESKRQKQQMEVTFNTTKYIADKNYKQYWKLCVAKACKENGVKVDLLRLFDEDVQTGLEVTPKKPKNYIPLKDIYSHVDIWCAMLDK